MTQTQHLHFWTRPGWTLSCWDNLVNGATNWSDQEAHRWDLSQWSHPFCICCCVAAVLLQGGEEPCFLIVWWTMLAFRELSSSLTLCFRWIIISHEGGFWQLCCSNHLWYTSRFNSRTPFFCFVCDLLATFRSSLSFNAPYISFDQSSHLVPIQESDSKLVPETKFTSKTERFYTGRQFNFVILKEEKIRRMWNKDF